MEEKKLSFFRKIKISIFDFDGYQNLAAEKISRTIAYIVLLMILLSVCISGASTFQFSRIVDNVRNYVSNEVSEITYEDYNLNIVLNSGEEITEITTDDLINVTVIINTATTDETKIQESIDKINSTENGILILKDRIIIKNSIYTNSIEYSYKAISEAYNINKIDKEEVLNFLSGSQIRSLYIMFFGVMTLYSFIVYFSNLLIDAFVLAILAYIVTRISGLRLKHTAIYNIAIYSFTLPIILNIIYAVVNIITGFTIQYFQIMYTTIASIYVITAILMIKSDVIKKQLELNKIIEEQERIKQELKQKEEEEKEKAEQERRRKKREKKDKEKEKKEKENLGKEPEGDNA